jgi:hypothetical protein
LALYGLDYPKVPLLLIDFRNPHAPQRREMLRRGVTDVISGVLGISKFGNWPYFAGSWAWNFVRARHGDPNNRTARLKAYSEVRQWLALDPSLDPDLRMELLKRVELLGVNPLEASVFNEADIARRQYAALLRYADSPIGLAAQIQRDRDAELTAFDHGLPARIGFRLANLASLGGYSHRESDPATQMSLLDQERNAQSEIRVLETALRNNPQPDADRTKEEVRSAIDQLTASGFPGRSAAVVEKILRRTSDEPTRVLAEHALCLLRAQRDASPGSSNISSNIAEAARASCAPPAVLPTALPTVDAASGQ